MNIELTAEQKALEQEVRAYMQTVMTPELLEEMRNDELKEGGGAVNPSYVVVYRFGSVIFFNVSPIPPRFMVTSPGWTRTPPPSWPSAATATP